MKYTAIMLLVLLAGCDSARYEFTEYRNGHQVGYMTDTYTGDIVKCVEVNSQEILSYIVCD